MKMSIAFLLALAVLTLTAGGCGETRHEPVASAAIPFASQAFSSGDDIPDEYTCDGVGVSPPLGWGELPEGTASLAVFMEDRAAADGETFVHWLIYNIPPQAGSLSKAIAPKRDLPGGAHQGRGTAGIGYEPPSPPRGELHRYHFNLYALDTLLELPGGATKEQLLEAMEGHVLGRGEFVGTVQR